ncbi:MAG: cation-translocating P-type ATPase [Anaerolineales bacterium]|nr:cation-translocating P-type ATPase [Anaerolineales bacterium]
MKTENSFSPQLIATEKEGHAWHAMQSSDVIQHLDTLSDKGLTTQEAEKRLQEYGPNALREAPPTTFLQMLKDQFTSFIVILLLIAAVISALLGDYVEAGAIMLIVILNATLGVVQERRAEQALAALRKLAAPDAHVIRDGSRQVIPSTQLVPGDLVLLEAGNYIPADIRLLEAINLRIEEAALTGESVPVEKDASVHLETDIPLGDRKNTSFMGTLVNYGRGKGVVVATGMHTQIGLIAEMLQSVENEPTPLQKRLEQLGKTLGYACLVICAVVFVEGWIEGNNPLDMFMVAVSLAVAAVPEGLPAVVTISLAMGMREMIKRHALIRRLSSVETLGSATVICSDKTGTLTQNEMTVTRVWVDDQFIDITGSGYMPQGEFLVDKKAVEVSNYQGVLTALWVAALNNDADLEIKEGENGNPTVRMVGDPTEGAMIVAAVKAGANLTNLNEAYPRLKEIPFDSIRKRMITIHGLNNPRSEDISPFNDDQEKPDGYAVLVKGAPDMVLELCQRYQGMDDTRHSLDENRRMQILKANDMMTQDALRVLGLAYRLIPELPDEPKSEDMEDNLVFVGLIGMIDPPRLEATPALEKAGNAGIRTIMITGDYPNTARAIAESIGLLNPGHQVLTGADLDSMSDLELMKQVAYTDVFARVSPEHKMRIVEALRDSGEVVAMTGDGVNDAPSIKRADIGVAMGITGTDVAKESADMVLTDDNYASIVSAVEQGRIIYSNIRKFVYYLICCNVAEILIIFLGTLIHRISPLTAIQLLWLNLITDGAPALALSTEKGDPDIMDQPPRAPTEPIINRFMQIGVVAQSIADTAVVLAAFALGKYLFPQTLEYAESMAFVTLSCSELARAFTARSERYPVLKIGIFNNKYMNLATFSSFALLIAVIYIPFLNPIFNTVPLGWGQWQYILMLMFIPSIVAELVKFLYRKPQKKI